MTSRRNFIVDGVSAITAGLVGRVWANDVQANIDGHQLPSWAISQIDGGVRRYYQWKGKDETVVFPLMTDCHSWFWGFSRLSMRSREDWVKATVDTLDLDFRNGENWADPKLHVLFMRYLAHRCGADFMVDLGDHDFEFSAFGEPIDLELAKLAMRPYRKLYESETLPTLFARGNHDHSRGRITDAEYGDLFNRSLNAAKSSALRLSADGTFGWLDLPKKKFRAVFLNTSRCHVNGLDAEELQFMVQAFQSAPDGYCVVLLQHIPVLRMQNWRRSIDTEDKNMRVAYSIIDSYANRRRDFVQGWSATAAVNEWKLGDGKVVRWSFKDVGSRFAGAFFGHEHVEDFVCYGNVPLVTRPGLGTIPPDCLAGEMRDVKNGGLLPKDTVLLDFVALKRSSRRVRVFRCGLGGESSDCEYVF